MRANQPAFRRTENAWSRQQLHAQESPAGIESSDEADLCEPDMNANDSDKQPASALTYDESRVGKDLYTTDGWVYGYQTYPKTQAYFDGYMEIPTVRHFFEAMAVRDDSPRVVDLGSGAGLESAALRARLPNARVSSIDVSTAGALSGKKTYELDQVQGDVCQTPFPSNSFDGIHCKDVLVHIPDKLQFMREIARLLKPEGTVLLVSSQHAFVGFHQFSWDIDELVRDAEACGLSLISQEVCKLPTDDWYVHGTTPRAFLVFQKKLPQERT